VYLRNGFNLLGCHIENNFFNQKNKNIMARKEEKIRAACELAFITFQKIDNPKYAEIKGKLEYVIGSYDFDKNPVGLYEVGGLAFPILKKAKDEHGRKITKKLLTDLEKALKE
jgi:hypothetical protein